MPHAPDLSGLALDERHELHAPTGEGAFVPTFARETQILIPCRCRTTTERSHD